jgi:2,4-dienoyl-CoA reductase (NADPH2)
VREAVGPTGIVGYRLGVDEFSEGGLTIDDACRAAAVLNIGGQIDYFSLSQGNFTSIEKHLPDRHQAPGAFTDLHAKVKRHIGAIPTVTCGRFVDAAMAEQTLAEGKADIIGLSRALTADPDWPRKSAGELGGSITPCIACNQCWVSSMTGEKIKCVVNPSVGNELLPIPPASSTRKHVLVVGGGAAGLEAARTAAERGARVTLMEAGNQLGGRLLAASGLPFQRELSDFATYLAQQTQSSGAEIRLNSLATMDSIIAEKADAIILALGAQPIAPAVPSDGSIEIFTDDVMALPPSEKAAHVIVVDEDGHNWSAAAAEFLALKGCQVTVITPFFEVFRELSSVSRGHVIAVLDRHRVRIVPNTRLVRVQNGAAVLKNKFSGREESTAAAIIHWIGSLRARDEITKALRLPRTNIHVIGDAVAPRRLVDAIAEGRRAGILVTS